MSLIRAQIENRTGIKAQSIRRVLGGDFNRVLNFEGQRLRRELIREIDDQNLVVSGDLRKSVAVEVTARGTGDYREVKVGPSIEYAQHIEFGTKPHSAPINALTNWVRARRAGGAFGNETGAGAARYGKSGRRLGNKYSQLSEDTAIAWRIWGKIKARGTKAHPFVRPTFAREHQKITARVNRSVATLLGRVP